MNRITDHLDGRLAVIGGGRMGEAIVGGLIASGFCDAGDVTVAEPDGARRAALSQSYGVSVVATGAEALDGARVALIAVKPQVIDSVVRSLSADIGSAIVCSIAAGITTARLESLLPDGCAVVRVMPNTPALVGAGMALVSGGGTASPDDVELVRAMFGAIGGAVVIDEKLQDAGTAISGSGPAYFALFIDALARAGVAQGLPRDLAQRLAVETMAGTAELLVKTGQHPGELIDGVASPGGTTIAALHELEAGGVRAAIGRAVGAAVARARELGA
jgi:pyrroline-5-carboxylate reductase